MNKILLSFFIDSLLIPKTGSRIHDLLRPIG
ncbi:hypothetical protein NTHI1209_01914 [Haemophilus influenzae]|uniref:Uncharacterized protein n=1 Tax=Haemophilus influenzae TaxID=727 RepID=A0A158SZH9_HAEIF|nr:hypothetical protein NTHI1209_01914 [Haemophilus influenzae]